MEPIHVDFFKTWNDRKFLNSEILAPPGVGKTTCLYGQDLWDMAQDRSLRFVRISCDLPTARKRLGLLRMYVAGRRLRALYPDLHVDLARPDNSDEFTVIRPNIGSQDPTVVAKGARSEIQGAGLERICADDLCSPKVRREPTTRDATTQHFKSTVLTRRRNVRRSRIRYIATPWHPGDTTSVLRDEIRKNIRPGWRLKVFPVKEDAEGNPIPLVKRPGWAEDVAVAKATDPVGYACSYRLDPRDAGLRKLDQLVYYDTSGGTSPLCPEHRRKECADMLAEIKGGETWTVLDPAFGGRDLAGTVDFSISATGQGAILAASFFRARATKIIKQVTDAIARKGTDQVLIESGGPQKGVADHWAEYLVATLGKHFRSHIHFSGTRLRNEQNKAIGQNVSKDQRYFNAIPYLESGQILFPAQWQMVKGKPTLLCKRDAELLELHDELLNYPSVSQDAGIDCVSLFINTHTRELLRKVEALSDPDAVAETQLPATTNALTLVYREMVKRRQKEKQNKPNRTDQEVLVLAEAG